MQGLCASESGFVPIEPDTESDVEFLAAMPSAGGGGKMSRDCCFKCAVNKHKSAVKVPMSVSSKTPILDRVRRPADLRNLSTAHLKELAAVSQPRQYEEAGLDAPQIVAAVLSALGRRDARRRSTLVGMS